MRQALVLLLTIAALVAQASGVGSQPDPKYNTESPVRRLAFVVGNSNYVSADPLPGSVNDARVVSEKLKAAGFTVTTVENFRTRNEFLTKHFLNFVDTIEEGDFVVFYYSGHGFSLAGESYLTPLEFPKPVKSSKVVTTFLAASALQERINLRNPALLIMFLDACRNITGLIDKSDGANLDIEKGLASRFGSANNIIAFAAAEGQMSLGNAVGGLSRYTAALAKRLATPDQEFDRVHKSVIADVRNETSNGQNPWIYGSSTLDVFINPADVAAAQFKQSWLAAQEAGTAEAIRDYLNVFGLGPYALAAKRLYAERTRVNSTFTQFDVKQIDALWSTALTQSVSGQRIKGPFGFGRIREQFAAKTLPEKPAIERDPNLVGNILASNRDVVVLSPTTARTGPDVSASVATSLNVGAKLAVEAIEKDARGGVWLKSTTASSPDSIYVLVPPTAGTRDVPLGRAIKEFQLTAPDAGSAGVSDEARIAAELAEISARSTTINWISISVPKADNKGVALSPRDAALLKNRAAHAAYVLAKTVPRGRIGILQDADFAAENPRVRIFGSR